MKKILTLVLFLFLATTLVQAQGSGNGQGNGNGYAWGNGNGSNDLVTWLENGGQVTQVVALAAIDKARDWGWQNFHLHYGQMVAKYAQGQVIINYVSVAPPTLIFSVRYGGQAVVVVLDSI